MASALLGLEALWWGGAGILGLLAPASTTLLLSLSGVGLGFFSVRAIVLLARSPRSGLRIGLALQAVAAVQGLVMLVFMASLVGAVEIVVAALAAICLDHAGPARLPQ